MEEICEMLGVPEDEVVERIKELLEYEYRYKSLEY